MGDLKQVLLDMLHNGDPRIADVAIGRASKRSAASAIVLPGIFAGGLYRRVIIDDGDEILVVLLFNKRQLGIPEDARIKNMLRRSKYSVHPNIATSHEYAENMAKQMGLDDS